MTETPRHSVSVAAAIFDDTDENVLLIQRRDNGRWEPPGGVLELDETLPEGLRREVREEAGVDVEVGPLTGVYKNMAAGIVALVFAARTSSLPENETAEASRVRWVPLGSVRQMMTPAYAVRVLDAKAPHAKVAVRAHDGHNLVDAGGMNEPQNER